MVTGTAGSSLLPVGNGPNRFTQGATGPLLSDLAKLSVAGVTEDHAFMLATGHSHRTGAGQGLDTVRIRKPLSIIAELG